MSKWVALAAAVAVAAGLLYVTRGRSTRMSACRTLVRACEEAGFKLGPTREQRRAFRDECLRPILRTGAFQGREFDQKIVSSCKARFEKMRQRNRNS